MRKRAAQGSLKERIYATVFEEILEGKVGAEEFLTEARLAERFGTSRAPAREALVALCNEGLLRNLPRVGYRVAAVSTEEVLETIEVRQVLEREAAIRAFERYSPDMDARIDELIREEEDDELAGVSLGEWVRHGDAVHFAIADFAGNAVLKRTIADLITRVRLAGALAYASYNRERPRNSSYHIVMLAALKERDEGELLETLRSDIDLVRDFLKLR